MKTIAVIPARYASTRMPGKPLADVLGKPMIWWVYQAAKACPKLDDVLIATDDERIADACKTYGMRYLMTSPDHDTPTGRIWECCTATGRRCSGRCPGKNRWGRGRSRPGGS